MCSKQSIIYYNMSSQFNLSSMNKQDNVSQLDVSFNDTVESSLFMEINVCECHGLPISTNLHSLACVRNQNSYPLNYVPSNQ